MTLVIGCGGSEPARRAAGETKVAEAEAKAAAKAEAEGEATAEAEAEAEGPAYPLDDLPRELPETGRVRCPDVPKVTYRGDVIRYHKAVVVYEGFRDHLRRFEELVRDTAIEVYGRAPKTIRHLGTYNCRRIRRWPTWLSEHGLANAIDVEGFDFGPAGRDAPKGLPRALRQGFSVRILDHWNGDRGVAAEHARFLRLLAQRVIDDEGLFRVILGPAEAGHQNHLHLDMAPWRIVNVF